MNDNTTKDEEQEEEEEEEEEEEGKRRSARLAAGRVTPIADANRELLRILPRTCKGRPFQVELLCVLFFCFLFFLLLIKRNIFHNSYHVVQVYS